jgi:deoxyribodipyrimidine photolyase-related protein
MPSKEFWLVLGNQLFPMEWANSIPTQTVFMAEDHELCSHFRYHKHKLILFLSAMRSYADALRGEGKNVHYTALLPDAPATSFEEKLNRFVKEKKLEVLHVFEIEDKFFEARIRAFCQTQGLKLVEHASPLFLTPRSEFAHYLSSVKKPFMKSFYERQRKRLNVLMTAKGEPIGGKWSFDEDNRKKLPKGISIPPPPMAAWSNHTKEVVKLVDQRFALHPGNSADFWLPTTRSQALEWLNRFTSHCLGPFGPYEDAIASQHPFVFHSVISPVLNLGLITPMEVIECVAKAQKPSIPLSSVEGFIRQVIGWREFIRGIYQHYSEKQDTSNFWGHHRKLSPAWYNGTTGIAPLDHTIQQVVKYGYCHHIERLMVLGNLFLLCEIDPVEVHAWFMELFVDSSDWVMGPNVYGMALFSDGGVFATKPYICASNYLLKMSDYKKGPWCEEVDALFWSFLEKHSPFFSKNPRLNMLVKTHSKKPLAQRKKLLARAESVRARLSLPAA